MHRLLVLVLVLLAACGSEPPRSSGGRPPTVRLIGENITLAAGQPDAVRIGFQPFSSVAQLRVAFTPTDAMVRLCPLPSVDAPITRDRCRIGVGSGVRTEVGMRGLRAAAIVLERGRATADVSLEFDEGGRDLALRLPVLDRPANPAACQDNACNPFFEVVPTRSGAFSARASWSGGSASLVLLQGRVLGRSFTATGIPYARAASAAGTAPLEIETRMSAPGEYALAFSHDERSAPTTIRSIAIDARWP